MTTIAPTGTTSELLRRLPPLPGETICWPAQPALPVTQISLDLDVAPASFAEMDSLGGMADRAGGGVDVAVRARAARFTLAVIETVTGDRQVAQLERWMTPAAYDALTAVTSTANRSSDSEARARTERPRLVSVHVTQPTPDAAEVCGHVRQGRRGRAVALRLDQQAGHWLCTAVQLG